MNLSKADLRLINEVFTQAYCFDLPEKWDAEAEEYPEENSNFTSKRFSQVWDIISQEVRQMSSLRNEALLETLFEEVCEEFPNNTEDENTSIAYQRFEGLQ